MTFRTGSEPALLPIGPTSRSCERSWVRSPTSQTNESIKCYLTLCLLLTRIGFLIIMIMWMSGISEHGVESVVSQWGSTIKSAISEQCYHGVAILI